MKIQMDIPTELNRALKIERLNRDKDSIKEMIITILEEYFHLKENEREDLTKLRWR